MANNIPERRSSIRYPIQQAIELELEDGTGLSVKTINISRSGLQFRCDNWTAHRIEPRGIQNHSMDHIDLAISVTLPDMQEGNLTVHGQIMYAQRLAQEEYVIGVQFTRLDGSDRKKLERLIEFHAKGSTNPRA